VDYKITGVSAADIYIIRALWEKLNRQHYENSVNFKGHYAEQTFEWRCEKFARLPKEDIFIEAAVDNIGTPVAYCICSVERGYGELDSIYIEPPYRKQSLGSVLARRGIEWLKSRGCGGIRVSIADGNESVLPFYGALGFKKRSTVFELDV
jgi:GNAT superfamily N-acetyltransferase